MGLLETTMELAKIAGQVANPELVREAMKANVEALELSRENLELQKRVTELEGTIARLQSKSDLTARVYRLGCYVFLDGDPGPHCSACWDKSHELIHIVRVPLKGTQCPICHLPYAMLWPPNPSRDSPGAVPAS
jgi:hypothetical protein